jgi:cytochrome oxidase Cu insertion factor (SCO1/SenC/PrrC family)
MAFSLTVLTVTNPATGVPQATANAQTANIDVETLGPKVGGHVPAFDLKDQDGKARTLDSIMGPKGAMLVFFRSADW